MRLLPEASMNMNGLNVCSQDAQAWREIKVLVPLLTRHLGRLAVSVCACHPAGLDGRLCLTPHPHSTLHPQRSRPLHLFLGVVFM